MTKDYVNTSGSECYAVARQLGGQCLSCKMLYITLALLHCVAAVLVLRRPKIAGKQGNKVEDQINFPPRNIVKNLLTMLVGQTSGRIANRSDQTILGSVPISSEYLLNLISLNSKRNQKEKMLFNSKIPKNVVQPAS